MINIKGTDSLVEGQPTIPWIVSCISKACRPEKSANICKALTFQLELNFLNRPLVHLFAQSSIAIHLALTG